MARVSKWILFGVCLGLLSACSSVPKKPALQKATSLDCQEQFEAAPLTEVLRTLQTVSSLYDQKCFREVISLGDFVRTHSRDKIYHLINETLEMVAPEGTFTEYVLESYERAYLSFLIASSYEQLALSEDTQVELRRAYLEGQALLYNYGDDPVNLVLQAALWENSHSSMDSRPLWKKVAELSPNDLSLQKFAKDRIQEIDERKKPSGPWKIYALGKFPELDWSAGLQKTNGRYFSIQPKSQFPMTCASEKGLFLPTEAWARKISHKYDRDYHPLLHLQTWTRLPVGLSVGAVTALSGVTVMVAGCGADFYVTRDMPGSNHALCEASLSAGRSIAGESGTVAGYVLRPDLRFWNSLPEAFLITREKRAQDEYCLPLKGVYRKPLTWSREDSPQEK